MRIKLIILFCLILFGRTFSQAVSDSSKIKEIQPEFVGGKAELDKFIKENLKLPAEYKTGANFTGCKVFVKFIIDEKGTVSEPKIIRGCFGFDACDLEAMRVVGLMPAWNPGKKEGKAVKRSYSLVIDFEKPK